jgi:hypothetical protein
MVPAFLARRSADVADRRDEALMAKVRNVVGSMAPALMSLIAFIIPSEGDGLILLP